MYYLLMDIYEKKLLKKSQDPNNTNLNFLISSKRSNLPNEYWEDLPTNSWYQDQPKRKAYRASRKYSIIKEVMTHYQGNKCFYCESLLKAKYMHHLTYNNYYAEKAEDIIILCNDCHEKNVHQILLTNNEEVMRILDRKGKSVEALRFLTYVEEITENATRDSVLTTKQVKNKIKDLDESFFTTVTSILINFGFMIRQDRGHYKFSNILLNLSKTQKQELYNVWQTSNRPDENKKLLMQHGGNGVNAFDRINHTCFETFCSVNNLDIESLKFNNKDYRNLKKSSFTKEKKQIDLEVVKFLTDSPNTTEETRKHLDDCGLLRRGFNDKSMDSITNIEKIGNLWHVVGIKKIENESIDSQYKISKTPNKKLIEKYKKEEREKAHQEAIRQLLEE